MKPLSRNAVALGFALTFLSAQATAQASSAAQPAVPPRSGVAFPQPGTNAPVANEGIIEDGAVDALKEMSAYLMSAKTLGIRAAICCRVVLSSSAMGEMHIPTEQQSESTHANARRVTVRVLTSAAHLNK